VGFFFSLGHSSIVLLLSIAIVLSASFVKQELPALRAVGQLIGSAVSASRASLNN
jgi:nickel/cobalt transporter (NiCoT) family protein